MTKISKRLENRWDGVSHKFNVHHFHGNSPQNDGYNVQVEWLEQLIFYSESEFIYSWNNISTFVSSISSIPNMPNNVKFLFSSQNIHHQFSGRRFFFHLSYIHIHIYIHVSLLHKLQIRFDASVFIINPNIRISFSFRLWSDCVDFTLSRNILAPEQLDNDGWVALVALRRKAYNRRQQEYKKK